jgi:hypothetical protein
VAGLLRKFAVDVESFYDRETRERGTLHARDRNGEARDFPLLTCSAAIVHLCAGVRPRTLDELFQRIASLKEEAKRSASGIHFWHAALAP